jgi:hypothetical protein
MEEHGAAIVPDEAWRARKLLVQTLRPIEEREVAARDSREFRLERNILHIDVPPG